VNKRPPASSKLTGRAETVNRKEETVNKQILHTPGGDVNSHVQGQPGLIEHDPPHDHSEIDCPACMHASARGTETSRHHPEEKGDKCGG
jgi:hypothetical protein